MSLALSFFVVGHKFFCSHCYYFALFAIFLLNGL